MMGLVPRAAGLLGPAPAKRGAAPTLTLHPPLRSKGRELSARRRRKGVDAA